MSECWKSILRKNFTHWERFAEFLELNEDQKQFILKKSHFPLNVPYRIAKKISKKTLDDPLLKQFLPTVDETLTKEGYSQDPVQDGSAREEGKLLHKYEGRSLILATSACAMHCRYCFRQHFPYETQEKGFEKEIDRIKKNPEIYEVILSGGDPLSLSNSILESLLDEISTIPHVTRIRFHSRFLIGVPERVDDSFLRIIDKVPQQILFVLHVNHKKELDSDIFQAIDLLKRAGALILNQAVLLKGINDDQETLKELFLALVDHGILPYYLHQLDPVQGAYRFEVSEEKGRELIRSLSGVLPGYAIPKYVREIPGKSSKTSLLEI